MKPLLIFSSFATLAAGIFLQKEPPANLKGHNGSLQAAQSFTAKVAVTPIGGAPSEVLVTFNRSGSFRIEDAAGFTLYDGAKVYRYDKKSNTYTEAETAKADALKLATIDEAWPWGAFYGNTIWANVSNATKGKGRNMRGTLVTEYALSRSEQNAPAVTLFVEDKTGIARGFSFKSASKDFVAFATEMTVGKEELAETLFAFSPPSGAVKGEIPVVEENGWAKVSGIFRSSCLPCHSAQNRRANYDLSSYDGIRNSPGAVNVENPDESFVIRSLRGDRAQQMPKNKAPLSKEQIQVIYDWMKAGAKK